MLSIMMKYFLSEISLSGLPVSKLFMVREGQQMNE